MKVGVLKDVETTHLGGEVEQLVKLFSSIKRKMKEKLEKKSGPVNV